MSSSGEDAMSRLRKWTETKAPLAASFVGSGLSFRAKGRLVFDEEMEFIWLVVDREGRNPKIALTLSLKHAVPCESFDSLRDAPEVWATLPFVIAEAFRLPYGDVDFRELASLEDE